jgi:hypothetical protein
VLPDAVYTGDWGVGHGLRLRIVDDVDNTRARVIVLVVVDVVQ